MEIAMTPDEQRRLARVETLYEGQQRQLDRIEQGMAFTGDQLAKLADTASKGKGGLVMLVAVGGVIGWVLDHVLNFLKHG